MNILLKSAKIVDPTNPVLHLKKRDLLIKNGKIDKIGAKLTNPSKLKELQLDNLHVSVGWFDSSVCFGEPGFEERETIANGLQVAAMGGFSDIVLNPNTFPSPDSSSDIIFLKEKAINKAVRLHPMGNLTMQGDGSQMAELFDMKNAGAVAFYDYKKSIGDSNLLKIALLYAQNFNGLVCSFPEDIKITGRGTVNEGNVSTRLGLKGVPALAEELQIVRDLYILEYTGGKLHIPTVSTARSVKLIAEAKKKNLDVTASVAIHNLAITDQELESFDSNFKVRPPLRSTSDTKALIKGLQSGAIDFVTADHTPIDIEEKRVEFDNAAYGTIGLESAFGMLNRLFGLEEAIDLLIKGRERFELSTPKIEEGAEACLTLFNPDLEYVFDKAHIGSKSKNAIFVGQQLKGIPYGVINNGRINIRKQ
ncbi:MAG: dihydroorotase [Croceitalea sp.]|nr:dihydroorotase [Croceitalea sp.]